MILKSLAITFFTIESAKEETEKRDEDDDKDVCNRNFIDFHFYYMILS